MRTCFGSRLSGGLGMLTGMSLAAGSTRLGDYYEEKTSIVVDFDGVICEHRFPDVGEPTEGVQEALNTLKKAGYRIVIHSCRTSFQFKDLLIGDQFDRIKDYMKYYKLPFDNVWVPDKPIGVAYIDDKGVNFNNNWGEITDKLLSKSKKNK